MGSNWWKWQSKENYEAGLKKGIASAEREIAHFSGSNTDLAKETIQHFQDQKRRYQEELRKLQNQ